MWTQTYGGSSYESAFAMTQTSDGSFAIAGISLEDFWLVRTDANGNMLWNQTYGGADSDVAYSLVEVSDGGFAIAGSTLSFGAGADDFWLVKTKPSVSPPVSPPTEPFASVLLVVVFIVLITAVAACLICRYKMRKSWSERSFMTGISALPKQVK